jgi:hypothetical protein
VKYIFWLLLPSAVTLFFGYPYTMWGGLWALFVFGVIAGMGISYEILAEGLSRANDPKWAEILKGFFDKVERKQKRRER